MKNQNLPLKVTHPNQLPHALQSELSRNRVRDTCRNYWTTALDCLHQGRSALTSHHQLSTVEDAFTSKGWSSASAGSAFQWGILPHLYQPERKTSLPPSVSMETPAILEINLPPPDPPSSDVTVFQFAFVSVSLPPLSLCIRHFHLTCICSPSDHFSLFLSHVVHSSAFTDITKKCICTFYCSSRCNEVCIYMNASKNQGYCC